MMTQVLVLEEIARMGARPHHDRGQCIHNMQRFGNAEQLAKTAEVGLTGIPAYSLAFTEPQAGQTTIASPPPTPVRTAKCI
jgi:alkylation response protein AidB-like acyl-CoA dehydrogenase